jgi:hypothetical protein
MSRESDAFVKCWATENVRPMVGLTDLHDEVVRLAAKLFEDAAVVGIRDGSVANSCRPARVA